MSKQKAMTALAKYQALSNASEFIRSHGEEGFSFDDENFNKTYLIETKKLSEKLYKLASKFHKHFESFGIEVNYEIDGSY